MATVNPYLNFDGNCEEVFNFYKSAFGGEFATVMRFKDMPGSQPDADGERIMHVALPLGNSMLMGSDRPAGDPGIVGDNFSISVTAESEAEADRIFNKLSAGGKVTMPLAKAPWNAYFGMFNDKYGVLWMINYNYPQPA